MLGSNLVGDEMDLIPNLSSNSKIWQSIGSNTLLQRVFMH